MRILPSTLPQSLTNLSNREACHPTATANTMSGNRKAPRLYPPKSTIVIRHSSFVIRHSPSSIQNSKSKQTPIITPSP
jgi:hypothetical protein